MHTVKNECFKLYCYLTDFPCLGKLCQLITSKVKENGIKLHVNSKIKSQNSIQLHQKYVFCLQVVAIKLHSVNVFKSEWNKTEFYCHLVNWNSLWVFSSQL